MWYLSSLNWEENPGRCFDPGECNIYRGIVHHTMITSGPELLGKLTSVTDLIIKQPAISSNIHFSKARWTLRAHFTPCHFLQLPDKCPPHAITEGPFLTHHAQGRALLPRLPAD